MNRPTMPSQAPVTGQNGQCGDPISPVPMNINRYPDGLRRALAALYSREPLTPSDVAEHQRLVARQLARDEAERSRQPDLLDRVG